jgi:hypothetical protein
MLNMHSLQHPAVKSKIKCAALQAWFDVRAKRKEQKLNSVWLRETSYIQNKKGNNFIRLDVYADGEIKAYSRMQKDVSKLIEEIIK